MGLSGFGHPEWDHHLKGNLDVVCFFNTDNLSERFCDFPEMPKVDYLAGGVEEGWWGGPRDSGQNLLKALKVDLKRGP